MHRQADDFFGHSRRIRQVVRVGAFQAPIGRESADKRIEVSATKNAMLPELEVEFVARHPVGFCINEDGEVGVVVTDARHIVEETDSFDVSQAFPVLDGDLMPGFNGGIDLPEVEQPVGGSDFIHLPVDAGTHYLGLAGEAEVFQIVDPLFGLGVGNDERAAFDGIEHLGGVETERGHVPFVEDAFPVNIHTEGVGGIINDTQPVTVGDFLNLPGSARLSVDVDRHDGCRAWRNGRFDPFGIHIAGGGVDVDEDGFDAVPPERMGRGYKAVGCRDDFTGDTEGLERCDQRNCSVREQADVGDFEIVAQGLFQPLMERTVVCNPLTVPDFLQHLLELAEFGKQGRGDSDKIIAG